MYDEATIKWFERHNIDPPTHEPHGEFNRDKLIPFKATRWWVEGNILYGEGNHGTVSQRIPTDYICVGTDDKNLPILKKVDIT